MRARNLAPKTIKTYLEAAGQLVDYVAAAGVESMAEIERHHVEDFISEQIETRSAATASVRFRALQQLFTWCLDEEELDANPMAKMRPPVVPERPVPVLGEDKARALLKACAGSGFVPRRDTAIVGLFLDTGMRLSELAKLRVDDRGRARSARGRRRHSIATCAPVLVTPVRSCRRYGWAPMAGRR